MTLHEDFETVRRALYTDPDEAGLHGSAEAALSRIEAEVERLRSNVWAKADKDAGYLIAEIERLKDTLETIVAIATNNTHPGALKAIAYQGLRGTFPPRQVPE